MRRVALFLILLAACGTTPEQEAEQQPAKAVQGRTPEQDRKYKEAAERGEVKYGMVRDEVRTAMRGGPQRTKKTTYKRKPATCWSYPFTDIYFDEDGYVIGWQSLTG
jgi:hypothetical protein